MVKRRFMKRLIFILALCFIASGCATTDWNRTFFAADLAKVSGGENKALVIKKLGNEFTPIALETKNGHRFEVLEFNEKPIYVGRLNRAYWTPYWIYFMDDKLVKYERAEGKAFLEHTKWMQEVQAMASTMDAFKGTVIMPYQVNSNVKSNVNVQGNVDVNIRRQ